MHGLNESGTATEDEQDEAGNKDSELYGGVTTYSEGCECKMLLLLMSGHDMLLSIGESLCQSFYALPFFELAADTELSPAPFDGLGTLLNLLRLAFDQDEFPLSRLQFCARLSGNSSWSNARRSRLSSVPRPSKGAGDSSVSAASSKNGSA